MFVMGLLLSRKRSLYIGNNNEKDGIAYAVPQALKTKLELFNFTEVEIKEVKDAFCMFDKQGNGYISRKSFLSVIRSLGQNPTEDEYDDMLNTVDADRNGLIEFSEFLELIAKFSTNFEETAQYLFHVFDYRGTGYIQKRQLREVLLMDEVGLTKDEVMDVLNCFRSDDKENIKMEEFTKVLKYLPTLSDQLMKPKSQLQPQEIT